MTVHLTVPRSETVEREAVGTSIDRRRDRDLVFRYVLERRAEEHPEREFLRFPEEGVSWSYSSADRVANLAANALGQMGVAQGDVVAILSENNSGMLAVIFGTTKLGAVVSPLNAALRGSYLLHALTTSGAKVLVVAEPFVDRLADALPPALQRIVVIGGSCAVPAEFSGGRPVSSLETVLEQAGDERPEDPGIHFWDPWGITFTSGTTGPSKGVLTPYGQTFAMVEHPMLTRLRSDDVLLGDLPLFHVSGWLSLGTTLYTGATDVIYGHAAVSTYWERVKQNGVTHITLLPAVAQWVQQRPASPGDADNPVRIVLIGKFFPGFEDWQRRFEIAECYSFFNMTEISSPLVSATNPTNRKSAGTPRPGVDLRLVDSNDLEVPVGVAGELLIRTDLPWELNVGYIGMPEATARAWRNGWFHTGDLFTCDADGQYYYVDRVKDSIRRRGENVSSYELEQAALGHPGVGHVAAVAVPAAAGEDEIKLCVIAQDGSDLVETEMIEFLRTRVPYFAVPRYIQFYNDFPVTPTGKTKKVELRGDGVEGAWDREEVGIRVSRHD